MSRVRARHVYGAAALLFVLVLGFQGIRLAAGEDPAGAATTPLRESAPPAATPTPTPDGGWGGGWNRRERPEVVPPDPGQPGLPDDPYGIDPGNGQGGVDPGGSGIDPGGQDGGGTQPAATTDA